MKPQGLSKGLAISLLLHLLTAASVIFIARFTQVQKPPLPYVVSLVDSAAPQAPEGKGEESPAPAKEESPQPKEEPKPLSSPKPKQLLPAEKPAKEMPRKTDRKADEGRIQDRIAAMEAKKRIERMAALRKMVDIGGQGSGARRETAGKGTPGSQGKDYYSRVMEGIRRQWIFPETMGRDLEAIVSIRIAPDGKVTILGMEKGSGNPLFDRSVLRAISMASPLPPPPQETEMGVRFRP